MHDFSLPHHAADKVKRALDDVLALSNDPGELLRIALMAASVPIGAAGGFISGSAKAEGIEISEVEATVRVLEFLKVNATAGVDAAFASLNKEGQSR